MNPTPYSSSAWDNIKFASNSAKFNAECIVGKVTLLFSIEFLRDDAGGVCIPPCDEGGPRNEFLGEVRGFLVEFDGDPRVILSRLAEFIGEIRSPLPCKLEQFRLEAGMVMMRVLTSIRAEWFGEGPDNFIVLFPK